MKALLTGRSGFLGKYIYDHLKQEGWDVVSIGRDGGNSIVADLTQDSLFIPNNINTVIHAAGFAHVFKKDLNTSKNFFLVNLEGTRNLLNSLDDKKIKHFVFISSVAVYGKSKGELLNESTTLSAIDPYGKSKIGAEKIILEWGSERNTKITILRLPLVVGCEPKGNLGDMIKAIQHGYYFNIAGGKARKSMVLAEDVAKFIPKAAEVGGIYNITDGAHPTFRELSYIIAKQLGKSHVLNIPLILAKFLAVTGDVLGKKFPLNSLKLEKVTSTLTFDDSKARTTCNWTPTPILKGFRIS